MTDTTVVHLRVMQNDPETDTSTLDDLVHYLDDQIAVLFQKVMQQDFFSILSDPTLDPVLIQTFLREVNREIYAYQPHMVEATISAIAQMPRSIEERTLKAMLEHQAEEFGHGEQALRGFVALGGDEKEARHQRISPASFAVGGLWRMIVHMRDPFVYFGALYLFERISPTVTSMAQQIFSQAGITGEAMAFIDTNSNEDIRHANLMRDLLKDIVAQYPQAAPSIRYGMECCLQVYPIPIWQTAFTRAHAAFSRKRA